MSLNLWEIFMLLVDCMILGLKPTLNLRARDGNINPKIPLIKVTCAQRHLYESDPEML